MYKFLIQRKATSHFFVNRSISKYNFCTGNSKNRVASKYLGLMNSLEELKKAGDSYSKEMEKINNNMKNMQNIVNQKIEKQKDWIENQKFNEVFSEEDKKFYKEKFVGLIMGRKEEINNVEKIRYEKEIRNLGEEYEKKITAYEKDVEKNILKIMEEFRSKPLIQENLENKSTVNNVAPDKVNKENKNRNKIAKIAQFIFCIGCFLAYIGFIAIMVGIFLDSTFYITRNENLENIFLKMMIYNINIGLAGLAIMIICVPFL